MPIERKGKQVVVIFGENDIEFGSSVLNDDDGNPCGAHLYFTQLDEPLPEPLVRYNNTEEEMSKWNAEDQDIFFFFDTTVNKPERLVEAIDGIISYFEDVKNIIRNQHTVGD